MTDWRKAVEAAAGVKLNSNGEVVEKGHVLVFIHGFNTDSFDMLERHRKIRKGLERQGYTGAVISFDWPSNGSVLGYASDRQDARRAAELFFSDGISRLSKLQTADCPYNIHVLAHSMGSFLLREAFDYADDDHETAQTSWTMSQVTLVAADISSKSMSSSNGSTSSLLRHCTRLTNYYSSFDEVLSISEVKRIGVARRLGRVGMPDDHSEKAVDVYCGEHCKTVRAATPHVDQSFSHRWYFEDDKFYEDLFYTLVGKLDRNVVPTRQVTDRGNLALA